MEQVIHTSLIIDPDRYLVHLNNAVIDLTKTEFRILVNVAEARGRILTRAQIALAVWGTELISYPRTIDVHITNIRKKIGPINDAPVISVVRGVGYKITSRINIIVLHDFLTLP